MSEFFSPHYDSKFPHPEWKKNSTHSLVFIHEWVKKKTQLRMKEKPQCWVKKNSQWGIFESRWGVKTLSWVFFPPMIQNFPHHEWVWIKCLINKLILSELKKKTHKKNSCWVSFKKNNSWMSEFWIIMRDFCLILRDFCLILRDAETLGFSDRKKGPYSPIFDWE